MSIMQIAKRKKTKASKKLKFDKKDLRLLHELELDATRTLRQLARKLGLKSSQAVHNKKARLERNRVIRNYVALLDYEKLGRGLTVLIHIVISSTANVEEILNKLKNDPRVHDVFNVTGRYDLILKAKFQDTRELGKFIFDKEDGLRALSGVERTESMIAVETIKEHRLDPDYVCGRSRRKKPTDGVKKQRKEG